MSVGHEIKLKHETATNCRLFEAMQFNAFRRLLGEVGSW